MNVRLTVNWSIGQDQVHKVEAVLFDLLGAIRQTGSLKSAALQASVSYRHAWGLLEARA